LACYVKACALKRRDHVASVVNLATLSKLQQAICNLPLSFYAVAGQIGGVR
jgi:hypothetical protein